MRTGNTHNINRPAQSFQTALESPTSPSAKRVKTESEQRASSSTPSASLLTDKAKRLSLLQQFQVYSYGVQLLSGTQAVHNQNVDKVHEQVEAFVEEFVAKNAEATPAQIRDGISRNMGQILKDAQLDISCYQAAGSEKSQYGKHLIFSSLSIPHLKDAPLCFQLFHFKPGQTTPIHNHPNPTEDPNKPVMVECASYIVDGMVNERLYGRLENDQDGNAQAEKTNKEFRDAGNRRVMDNPGTNPPHSIKNAGDKVATTVHAYTMDGISDGHRVAVQAIFKGLKNPNSAVYAAYNTFVEKLETGVQKIAAQDLSGALKANKFGANPVIVDIRIGFKLTNCYPIAPDAPVTEHGKSSKALKKEQKDQDKRQRIQNVFDGARRAAMHEGNAKSTLDFLRIREEAMQYPKTSATTKIKQKLGISPKTVTRTSLIDQATGKFVEGVLGLPADLKEQKKGWRRAASVEFLHTSIGRLMSLIAGLGSLGIDSELGKAVVHQTLGYGPQAPVTGFGRMASEIWQVQLNDGGKPKLPPQVQNAPALKEVRKGMKDVKQALRETNPELREAIVAAFTPGASPEALENLKNLRDKVSAEKTKFDVQNKKYTWRFAAFKRQYVGKRWGGAVSAFAGSVATPLSFTIPPAGIAAQAAGTFLLQPPAGYVDFMKDKHYTLRIAAKKIELSDLLKKESRGKSLDEITEDDIDIKMASKLYEQKPQAIIGVTREIYRYKLAELMATQRKLRADIEKENYVPYLPKSLFDQKARKEKALQEVTDKIEKLKIQIGHFERGEADQIDPDQAIGKALHNAWYFVKNGTMARYNNKVGEFWAQTFQRLGNNFHMLSSIGAMTIVTDILNNLEGHDMIKDGIASLEGHETHDTHTEIAVAEDGIISSEGHDTHHAYDVNEEIAAPAIIGAQVGAGLVSGITVIPARDYKDTVDRKVLAVPDWVKKDLKSGGVLRDYLEDAVKKGAIKLKEKERIEKAAEQREEAQATGKPLDKKAEKVLKKWEKFSAQIEANQKNWVVTDIIGKDGKPMTIDLRDSAACYRENVSMMQRALRVLKAIPPGLISGPALLLDSLKTRHARKVTRDLVKQSNQLIVQADEILKEKGQATEIQDVNSVGRLKSDSDYQRKLARLQAGSEMKDEDTFRVPLPALKDDLDYQRKLQQLQERNLNAANASEMTDAEIPNNGETPSVQEEIETPVSGEDLQEEENSSLQKDTFATPVSNLQNEDENLRDASLQEVAEIHDVRSKSVKTIAEQLASKLADTRRPIRKAVRRLNDTELETQIAHGFVKDEKSLWKEAMLVKMKREETSSQMQLNSSSSGERTGKDLRAIKKALDVRESSYPNFVRLQQGISHLKSKIKYTLDNDAKVMTQLKPKTLDELMIGRHTTQDGTKVGSGLTGLLNPATKERKKREELVEKIHEKLKPSEKLETLSLQDLKKKRRAAF